MSYYDKMTHNNELKFSNLCKKLIFLLLILGARRKQTLMTVTVGNIILYDDKVVLIPNKTLKHSASHRLLEYFVYNKYLLNEKVCIANSMRFYLQGRNRTLV